MNVGERLKYGLEELKPVYGRYKVSQEDFVVEEVPSYEPSGEGEHLYLWVEKQGLSSGVMLKVLGRECGVNRDDIGAAGNKDRHAITRQWFSIPTAQLEESSRVWHESLPWEIDRQAKVLARKRHGNKLRRGHLKGNLFELRLHLDPSEEGESPKERQERMEARLEHVQRHGVPNYYGDQRFGNGGQNVAHGVTLLQGGRVKKIGRDRFKKRLVLNAVQSQLFNEVVEARLGSASQVLEGDVLCRLDSHGMFVAQPGEEEELQRRLDVGEIGVTGPMFGPKMVQPQGEPARMEQEVLERLGVPASGFERFPRMTPGSRRLLWLWPKQWRWSWEKEGEVLNLSFFLPSGSYATIICDALLNELPSEEDA